MSGERLNGVHHDSVPDSVPVHDTDFLTEMHAYDQLPPAVRWALWESPIDQCASVLLDQIVGSGFTAEELTPAALEAIEQVTSAVYTEAPYRHEPYWRLPERRDPMHPPKPIKPTSWAEIVADLKTPRKVQRFTVQEGTGLFVLQDYPHATRPTVVAGYEVMNGKQKGARYYLLSRDGSDRCPSLMTFQDAESKAYFIGFGNNGVMRQLPTMKEDGTFKWRQVTRRWLTRGEIQRELGGRNWFYDASFL